MVARTALLFFGLEFVGDEGERCDSFAAPRCEGCGRAAFGEGGEPPPRPRGQPRKVRGAVHLPPPPPIPPRT